MVEVTCPACSSITTAPHAGVEATCPSCGRQLTGGPPEASASSVEPFANAALLADLRDAFDSCDYRLDGKGASVGSASEAASSDVSFKELVRTAPLAAGTRLGDFEIICEIGHGGMGVVYRATQVSLHRQVALKVLPAAATRRRSASRRFRTEAQAVARLNHPNVVPVFAHGEQEGHLYYAMELLEGVTLDVAIHSRPDLLSSTFSGGLPPLEAKPNGSPGTDSSAIGLPGTDAVTSRERTTPIHRTPEDFRHLADLMADVADGLEHAHQNGVIHRDIKPQNLLLGGDNRLRIADFGLAYLADDPERTVAREIVGTPGYLSPEQVRGDFDAIDHRTDIYSLGVTIYELVTGQRPFDAETRDHTLRRICTSVPRRPRELDSRIPLDLEAICLRAMDKYPARRHASAAMLAEDLRRFTQNRPILSRRTGVIGRTAKWISRHRALSISTAAAMSVVLLGVWLAATVAAGRRNEANQLVKTAYEQLVYRDYRTPELVQADIERATRLGADPIELDLTKALASLGASRHEDAIGHLDAVLHADPENMQALYLLAWAQWRNLDRQASRVTIEKAEELGGPQGADEWFLRGMAVHFDQPDLAIESYRQANVMRAGDHQFFPQAVLHLARAFNQRLYAQRDIDAFPNAQSSLMQLIEQQHYGGYPYYLLSIAHRLAGEIASASEADDGTAIADTHFTEGLEWARKGQAIDPGDPVPVMAEAECLERLGRFEKAIEARTRAIDLAEKDRVICENYHYRWRLYYWTNQWDAALADLELHAACLPNSRFYAHAYPSLVLAEMGDMQLAKDEAWAIAEESPDDPLAVIWTASCLRLLGNVAEAEELLKDAADDLVWAEEDGSQGTEDSIATLYDFCAGIRSLEEVLTWADGSKSRRIRAMVRYHAAIMVMADGDRVQALHHLQKAYHAFDGELSYTFHAMIVSRRLRDDAGWPPWLPVKHSALARDSIDSGHDE